MADRDSSRPFWKWSQPRRALLLVVVVHDILEHKPHQRQPHPHICFHFKLHIYLGFRAHCPDCLLPVTPTTRQCSHKCMSTKMSANLPSVYIAAHPQCILPFSLISVQTLLKTRRIISTSWLKLPQQDSATSTLEVLITCSVSPC